MNEDVKKVIEATRVIADVCAKYHYFKKGEGIICREECPFYCEGGAPLFDCRLCNYPFDYENEVERELISEEEALDIETCEEEPLVRVSERTVVCGTCEYDGDCERQKRLGDRAYLYCIHWKKR